MKKLIVLLLVLVLAFSLAACDGASNLNAPLDQPNIPATVQASVDATMTASEATAPTPPAKPTSASGPVAKAAVAEPAVGCDQSLINPHWTAYLASDAGLKAVYDEWLARVQGGGAKVYAPTECNFPVDSHIVADGGTIDKPGPVQLVSKTFRAGQWTSSFHGVYKLAAGFSLRVLFDQGDAPVAVTISGDTVYLDNDFSNGVSVVGIVQSSQ